MLKVIGDFVASSRFVGIYPFFAVWVLWATELDAALQVEGFSKVTQSNGSLGVNQGILNRNWHIKILFLRTTSGKPENKL